MDVPENSNDREMKPTPSRGRSASDKGRPEDPGTSADNADRLSVLAHELSNLLDGSIRCLNLAERDMSEPESEAENDDPAKRRLDTVRQALLRMSELVDNAMRPGASPGGSSMDAHQSPVELGEAVFHAVDVLTPVADQHGVMIKACVSNGLGGVRAGPLYPVIVNGIRNAIDAVVAANAGPSGAAGLIDVSAAWTDDGRVRITIQDEGIGLPEAPAESLFRFGYTTKQGGAGIGLAVAREVIGELPDGAISLRNRTDRPAALTTGAVLEVSFRPAQRDDASAA